MSPAEPRVIELTEYKTAYRRPGDFPASADELLWKHYKNQIRVEGPSYKNDHRWEIESLGYVGYLPLTPELALRLKPKVPIGNLFRMLEYAYTIDPQFLEGLMGAESLDDFYERLAGLLASRVLRRARRGLYASYVPVRESLPYVRGTVDLRRKLLQPWKVALPCDYQDHTSDLEENQILAWTLLRVAQSGICSDRTLPQVRRAHRALQGRATIVPFDAVACVGRLYNRLNDDYSPMHGLCRFFLEHTGPRHDEGGHAMVPFLVDMATLFERFVAEWLIKHLPSEYQLQFQETVDVGEDDIFKLRIDMVLYERATGRPLCVMDAKYKAPDKPGPPDIYQVVTYAQTMGCQDAVLVYPTTLPTPIDHSFQDIRVRSLTFSLDGDLDAAGESFVQTLLAHLGRSGSAGAGSP